VPWLQAWETSPPLVPAKAGTQGEWSKALDSRLRGNERRDISDLVTH
jgi:hypothetical protein